MAAFTCKDCTDRHIGCHDTCEKYIKEKMDHDLYKEKLCSEINKYSYSNRIQMRNKQLRKYGKSFH